MKNKPNTNECKPLGLISFIDDIHCCNSKIILKLFEFPSEIVLSAEHSEKYFAVLSKAYKSGKPLKFSISTNGRLIECSEPESNQMKAYMDDFKSIQSPIKYIRYKHNISLKKMSDTFKAIYMKFSNSKLVSFGFDKGCEFRSQLVSDFLQKIKQLKPYKLFLKGDLRTSINGKKLSWCNHVVNLLLLENKTGSEFKVFDPWTLNDCPGLETYLMN
ncbi:MAG TPA: protein-glutamine glutaminase family protein [Bacteroidia bacterium]